MKKSARALSAAIIAALALDCTIAADLRAECYVKEPLRPVHRTYIRRDVVEPGVYDVSRTPSVYGWTDEAVHEPGETIWHEEPSLYRTVPVRVRRPGGWLWRKQCIGGKEAVCRVRTPPAYMTVEKRVLVRRGKRWSEKVPASTGYVQRRLLLKPYKNYAHFQRPYTSWYRVHLTIQPEGYRWVRVPGPDC